MAQTVNIPIQVDTSQAQQGLQTLTSQSRQLNQQLSAITNVTRGVVAGFTAVKAVTNLLGQENEDLAKSLVKVQAGMALVQSLGALAKGINSANVAFRAFNTTLLSNPIVLITTAVLALTAALIGFYDATNDSTLAQEALDNKIKDIDISIQNYTRSVNILKSLLSETFIEIENAYVSELEALVATGASAEEYAALENKYAVQRLEAQLDSDRKRAASAKEVLQTILDEEAAYYESRIIKDSDATKEGLKQFKERREAAQENLNSIEESIAQTGLRIRTINANYTKSLKKDSQEQADAIEIPKAEAENYERALQKVEQAELRLDSQREKLRNNEELSNAQDEERLLILQNWIQEREQEIMFLNQELELLDESDENLERRAELTNQLREAELELFNNRQQLGNESSALNLKRTQEEEEAEARLLRARLYTYNQTAKIVGDSAKLFSDNTVAFKVLSTASATISTYAGAAQVLADPELPYYAKIAGVAATITTGLLMVKNIFDTDVPGASDTTSSPNIRTIPEIEPQITETHNNLNAYEEDLYNRTVLVVEDVNEVQNRLMVVENNSIF